MSGQLQVTLLERDYDGEGIVDIERDIIEALDTNYNQQAHRIALDEWNIPKGTFKLSLKWEWDFK